MIHRFFNIEVPEVSSEPDNINGCLAAGILSIKVEGSKISLCVVTIFFLKFNNLEHIIDVIGVNIANFEMSFWIIHS
jgi:hypothetical protein